MYENGQDVVEKIQKIKDSEIVKSLSADDNIK